MGQRWTPDADSVNAPEEALLRADNLVPDQIGGLSVRAGSSKIYSGLTGTDVHSLHTVELADGTTYRVTGAGAYISINDEPQVETAFAGSGDIAICDDSYQIFMARGSTKKKFDGTTFRDWALTQPEGVATLAAVTAITKTAAAFSGSDASTSNETPALTQGEGTKAFVDDSAGTSFRAAQLTPATATSRGDLIRLFTTDQDYLNISGFDGSLTDLFDVSVKFEDPYRVSKVTIMFGIGDSSTRPFDADRFEFTFDINKGEAVNIKDPASEGYGTYEAAVKGILAAINPKYLEGVSVPSYVKKTINSVGNTQAPKSSTRPEPNVWGHLSVTRGQFKRIGSTGTRGWNTVRGFKVVYEAQKGYVSKATFTDALMIGGGDRSLTGNFKCVIVGARITDRYIELSLPSLESNSINLNHQTLQITIPATMVNSKQEQVDEYWIYLFGGFLDTYYRFATMSANPQSGMTIDELTVPDGSDMNDAGERSRLTSHGMTKTSTTSSSTSTLVLTLDRSELDALTENVRLQPYQGGPPDNIVAIAGPWNGRIFTLTSEGYVYPSSARSPSNFNTIYVIDLTKYGNPLWMLKTASGIYVGCEKDVIFLAGSGDENPEQSEIDLYPQPLNIGNPPIDKCAYADGNSVIFRSADGLMMLSGSSLSPLPTAGTSLLWRGQDRHGVSALNTSTGRFRSTVDNMMYYMLAPEGTETSGNVIYRYSFANQQWSRLHYDQVVQFKSLIKEPGGTLIAGDAAGNLWQLDTGVQDDSSDIAINALTPIVDGGQPFAQKDSFDLQLHCDTGGDTGTVALYKDGSVTLATSYAFVAPMPTVYRINASDLGTFLKAQLRITGSFNTFALQNMNLTYRVRPQNSMYLDTGYIIPAEPGDLVWLSEAEVDMITPSDVTLMLYIEDALFHTATITAVPNVRKPYIVPLPRDAKGYRPRIVLATTASNAAGAVGFECYKVRIRSRSSGNQNGLQYSTVFPVGTAP